MPGLTPGTRASRGTSSRAAWSTGPPGTAGAARPPTLSVPSWTSSCRAATPPPSEQRSPYSAGAERRCAGAWRANADSERATGRAHTAPKPTGSTRWRTCAPPARGRAFQPDSPCIRTRSQACSQEAIAAPSGTAGTWRAGPQRAPATNDARNVRRPPTTGYATVRSPWAISTAIGTSSLPPNISSSSSAGLLLCRSADCSFARASHRQAPMSSEPHRTNQRGSRVGSQSAMRIVSLAGGGSDGSSVDVCLLLECRRRCT